MIALSEFSIGRPGRTDIRQMSCSRRTTINRRVAGTEMIDGEVVMVPPAVENASLGKCCWCNGSLHGNGDWRAVSMMTKLDDDEWDWLSGEYIP